MRKLNSCLTQVMATIFALPLVNCGSVVQTREQDAGVATDAAVVTLPTCSFSFSGAPSMAATGGAGDVGSSQPPTGCDCTRRPGVGNTSQCPLGAGVTVSADVGPAGANLQLSGTPNTLGVPVQLRIPPNALSQTVTIRITETNVPPPAGFGDFSPLYYFEPEGLTFNAPVQVQLPANSGYLPPTSSFNIPPNLSIYWSSANSSCSLEPLADNYINAGFNQASITRLGWGVVGVVPLAAGCP